MSVSYSVYGLILRANRAIPGLTPLARRQTTDLEVQLGVSPPWLERATDTSQGFYISAEHDHRQQANLKVWKLLAGEFFCLQYSDGTQFVVDRRGTEIWATWPESLSLEDTAIYLLGPVLGFALLLRGTICLHASAFAVENQAIALVGQAGAGKSTTAAAFAELGYKILSDDVVTLNDRGDGVFFVQPAYPCIRLWPSSVEALYGKADALPLLTPNWDKRYLDLTGNGLRFQQDPLPLAAIYILGERRNDPAAPFAEEVPRKQSLIELIANTYATYLMDTAMRAHEFLVLSRLVRNVPLRRAIPHADPAYLSKFCEVIIEDCHRANVSSLPA